MVCSEEAQEDLEEALGAKALRVTRPTWADHVYSCDYEYPNGAIGLSVKDLSSVGETIAYFESRATVSDRVPGGFVMGDAWYAVPDGSIVLRKDFKVLEVDVSRAPDELGTLSLNAQQVAWNVAETVMGCWVDA